MISVSNCDHKFLGTRHCIRCGWLPPEAAAAAAAAVARGQRVVDLCDAVIDRLRFDAGVSIDPDDARVAIFETLAHALYGDGTPIDVPTLRRRG